MICRVRFNPVTTPVFLALAIALVLMILSFVDASANDLDETMSAPVSNGVTAVLPVLFVPKDLEEHSEDLESIYRAVAEVSSWYAQQLDGRGFRHLPAVRVEGKKVLADYCPTTIREYQCVQVPGEIGADPDDIYPIIDELTEQGLGIQPNRIVLIFWVGGYGYAGASHVSRDSGWAAMGDWALDSIAGRFAKGTATGNCQESPYAEVFCRETPGGIAHELGHAFGLPHPVDDGSPPGSDNYWLSTVMAVHWDWPSVQLINSLANPEKDTVRKSKFFWPNRLYVPMVASE